MAKQILFLIIILSIILNLNHCKNVFYSQEIAYQHRLALRIGMPKDRVIELIHLDQDIENFIAESNDLFRLAAVDGNDNIKNEFLIKKIYNPVEYQFYLYAFTNNELIFWGYLYEFNRSENYLIKAIGKNAIDIINKNEI